MRHTPPVAAASLALGAGLILGSARPAWAQAAPPGEMTLRPAEIALQELESYALAAATEEPTGQPATTQPPSTQPASAPTTQPEAAAWPPGLLQQILDAAGLKKPMKDLGVRAYGWVETGFTGRMHGGPSRHNGHGNVPLYLRVFDAHEFNNLLLNQLDWIIERPIDTSKPFDLGARCEFLFGSDARNIHSLGLFDWHSVHENPPYTPLTTPWPFDHREDLDLLQIYAEMWIKTGENGQGIDTVFGKWVTPMGAEVIAAPGNFLYSHSYIFGFGIPFAHTGVKVTYNFNSTNNIMLAVVQGWDVWRDNNECESYMIGYTWSSKKQVGSNPRWQWVVSAMAGPEQNSNPHFSGLRKWHANPGNRYVIDSVFTYRWTEKLTQVTDVNLGFEKNVAGSINHEHIVAKRDSDWEGIAHYLNYVFNDYVSATGRIEWFRDHFGTRTGFPGDFFELTTGVELTPCAKNRFLKDLSFRPELRWDWSANQEPFSSGNGFNGCQLTAAIDMIYKF